MKTLISLILLIPMLSIACETPDSVVIVNGADYAITVARDYPITELDLRIEPYRQAIYKNPKKRLTFERYIDGADPFEFDICREGGKYPEAVIFTQRYMFFITIKKLKEINLHDAISIEENSYFKLVPLD